jgi:hypothetical protein
MSNGIRSDETVKMNFLTSNISYETPKRRRIISKSWHNQRQTRRKPTERELELHMQHDEKENIVKNLFNAYLANMLTGQPER